MKIHFNMLRHWIDRPICVCVCVCVCACVCVCVYS